MYQEFLFEWSKSIFLKCSTFYHQSNDSLKFFFHFCFLLVTQVSNRTEEARWLLLIHPPSLLLHLSWRFVRICPLEISWLSEIWIWHSFSFLFCGFSGKGFCNVPVLVSWTGIPCLLEQYADYRRLLLWLVPGEYYFFLNSLHCFIHTCWNWDFNLLHNTLLHFWITWINVYFIHC